MKSLTLTRYGYTPMGTFGLLKIEGTDFQAYTCERPWQNNERGVSCIPEGVYPIVPCIHHPGQPDAYPAYLLQKTDPRAEIEIHVGNTMDDVQGCILLGSELGFAKGKWAVVNSTTTFKRFMELMAGDSGTLSIRLTWDRPRDG